MISILRLRFWFFLIVFSLFFLCSNVYAFDFLPANNIKVGREPIFTAITDINKDNHQDLVVANSYSNFISVLLGKGDGTFGSVINFPVLSRPYNIAVADINNDGNLDLAVANYETDSNLNNLSILLGNGDGTFAPQKKFSVGDFQPRLTSVATADFDEDGNLDLAVVNFGQNRLTIMRGDGDGNFSKLIDLGTEIHPVTAAIADINQDGHADIVLTNMDSGSIYVFQGLGNGHFNTPLSFKTGYDPRALHIIDVDKNGILDFITGGNAVSVLLGQGGFSFSGYKDYSLGAWPLSVAIADFDSDSKQDIAVPQRFKNGVDIGTGDGTGALMPKLFIATGEYPRGASAGDFNEDGQPDLVVANTSHDTSPLNNLISILLNNSLLKVEIDIKPDTKENGINLKSQGSIPVAILGSKDFNVSQIDVKTLRLAGATMTTNKNGVAQANFEDINKDGEVDLVAHFRTQELRLSGTEKNLELRGNLKDGRIIKGSDDIYFITYPLLYYFKMIYSLFATLAKSF